MPELPRTYLGDGVYARFDGFQVWVYTDNGVVQSTAIALEPAVLAALVGFDAKCRREATERLSR